MLKVFDAQEKDNSIIEYEWIQRFCQDGSAIQNIKKTLYEIYLTDRDQWMNLSEAFLEARVQIIQNGVNPDTPVKTGNIAMVNNAYNLFKRCELQFDGKTLIESRDYPGWVNQITGLAGNSKDSEVQLSNEGWFPDRYSNLLPGGPSAYSIYDTAKLVIRNVGNFNAGAVQTNNANFGQILQITGSAANPHLATVNFYANFGGVAPVANDCFALFYNGQQLQIFKNGLSTGNMLYTNAGGTPNCAITGHIRADGGAEVAFVANDIVTFYLNGKPIVLTSANLPALFSVNGTPTLVFDNGTAVASTIDDNIALGMQPGFLARRNKFYDDATSSYDRVATFWLPLRKMFGFLDYNRIITKGMVTKLSLYVNDDARALFRDNSAVDGHLKFYALNLWVPYVVPKRSISDMLNVSLVENKEIAMGFYDYKYIQYPNPITDNSQIQWVVQQDTTKPVRVYAFFQPINAQNQQTTNSMLFGKAYVQTARCIINSNVIYPKEEYNIEFNDPTLVGVAAANAQNKNYNRAYLDFIRSAGRVFTNSTGTNITIDEFANLYQIFSFDLTKQDDERIYEYTGTNTIQLRFTFDAATTPLNPNLYLYAYVVNERTATMSGMQGKLNILSA